MERYCARIKSCIYSLSIYEKKMLKMVVCIYKPEHCGRQKQVNQWDSDGFHCQERTLKVWGRDELTKIPGTHIFMGTYTNGHTEGGVCMYE